MSMSAARPPTWAPRASTPTARALRLEVMRDRSLFFMAISFFDQLQTGMAVVGTLTPTPCTTSTLVLVTASTARTVIVHSVLEHRDGACATVPVPPPARTTPVPELELVLLPRQATSACLLY